MTSPRKEGYMTDSQVTAPTVGCDTIPANLEMGEGSVHKVTWQLP